MLTRMYVHIYGKTHGLQQRWLEKKMGEEQVTELASC
jgi:hypothetical protein